MANRTGLGALLERLYLQFKGYQQTSKTAVRDKEQLQGQPGRSGTEKPPQEHLGPLLEIGNELLITDEIAKKFIGLSKSLGRVVVIDHISTIKNKSIQASAFGIQVDVDMNVAQQMRQAFLQREQRMS